ncbi:MAG TPA: helix-turn-helix domain-containing protein [Thermoleophilaceae bacterium]
MSEDTTASPDIGPSSEDALARVGRAFSHPLRIRIVLALDDLSESSPMDLAERVDAPLGTVSYHVRYLADLGAIELRRMVPRRGALQHYYALTPTIRTVLPLARRLGSTAGNSDGLAPV